MQNFINLFPPIGFTDLNPDAFQELMDIIRQQPELHLQRLYFGWIMKRLFNGYEIANLFQKNGYTYRVIPELFKMDGVRWGWFIRLGQAPWKEPWALSVALLSDRRQADAKKVLDMVRRMHDELKYEPSYSDVICAFMHEFDAPQKPNKEAPFTQESVKNLRAMMAFNQGQKMPRKLKKHIKKLQQNSR